MNFVAGLARLCADVGLLDASCASLTDALLKAHSEPQRHYHTRRHVEAVLAHLETLGSATVTARFAAFFHDAVYDPERSDNEELSAKWASEALTELGLEHGDDVAAIIRATAGHEFTEGLPGDAASFLDADLAILGQPPIVYNEYVMAIRAEYSHLSDDEFRTGRAAVLQHFADRPTLFFTPVACGLWEAQARTNLARELASLAS